MILLRRACECEQKKKTGAENFPHAAEQIYAISRSAAGEEAVPPAVGYGKCPVGYTGFILYPFPVCCTLIWFTFAARKQQKISFTKHYGMIAIVWRGSGIMVLIYFFLSAWLCHFYFDGPHNLNNDAYVGWTLFWAAIATAIHALLILVMKHGEDPNEPKTEDDPPRNIWHSSLFFIPVMIWPLIFGGLSAKFLIGGDDPGSGTNHTAEVETTEPEEKVVSRTIYFLNSSEDTMYYEISGTDGAYEYEGVEPRTYISRTLDPGKYVIRGFDKDGYLVYTFPSEEIAKNKTLSAVGKDHDGESVAHRIIGEGTETDKDCDDIWVVLNGERDMLLVDVTSLCHDGVTAEEVEKAGWSKLTLSYDGRDLVEPLYGRDPGTNTYTVLETGDDIPVTLKKNERVYALMSCDREQEITDEYLAGRIKNRIPALAE